MKLTNSLSLINEIGIEQFLYRLQEETSHRYAITDEILEKIYGDASFSKEKQELKKFIVSNRKSKQNIWFQFVSDKNTVFRIYKLRTSKHLYGYAIITEGKQTFTEEEHHQLESFIPIFVAELIKKSEVDMVEKKYQNNFIYDLLYNNFASKTEVIDQAKRWGWDLNQAQHLLLIECKELQREDFGYISTITNNILSQYFYKAIICELNQQLVVIFSNQLDISTESKEDMHTMITVLRERLSKKLKTEKLTIGVGRNYPSISDLCRSYQEAKMALALSQLVRDRNTVTYFDDLGIIKILANVHHEQLEDFLQEHLAKLIVYDSENESELLKTLHHYYVNNSDHHRTAESLFIHTNTLRNRLRKIENLLNIDLQNSEDFLNLYIAMKIHLIYNA